MEIEIKDFKITEKMLGEISLKFEKQQEYLAKFWQSQKFEKMISDVIKTKEILYSESWLYTEELYRKKLNWDSSITKEDVNLFFDCLSNESFPIDKSSLVDADCHWENITYFRR